MNDVGPAIESYGTRLECPYCGSEGDHDFEENGEIEYGCGATYAWHAVTIVRYRATLKIRPVQEPTP